MNRFEAFAIVRRVERMAARSLAPNHVRLQIGTGKQTYAMGACIPVLFGWRGQPPVNGTVIRTFRRPDGQAVAVVWCSRKEVMGWIEAIRRAIPEQVTS